MTVQFPSNAAPFIATSGNILGASKIEITVGSDFEIYKTVVEEGRPSQKLGDPFNPDYHDLDAETGFWLIGRNQFGELIHTQAFKTISLQDVALSTYLMRNYQNFPPPIPGVDLGRSRYRASPGAHRINGHAVYHGEVWMAPDDGLYRGTGLSSVLTRAGILEAVNRWDPDWIFGFMLRAVAFKGFSERVGYMHTEPGALKWAVHGREQLLEAFMVYLSREDARFMLDIPVEELVA